jgi:hypothetical protein
VPNAGAVVVIPVLAAVTSYFYLDAKLNRSVALPAWECAGGLQAEIVVPDPAGHPAEKLELIKDIEHAVGREELRCRHDLEVQVRSSGVAACPDQPEEPACS